MTRPAWLNWHTLLLALLLLASFALRLYGLGTESLSVDELYVLDHARGVLQSGYPHRQLGSIDYHLWTYEATPYPLSLFLWLFGMEAGGLRLCGALLGLATTGMILLVGGQLFNRFTGFLAALLYAFSPWAIHWGQNVFHPAQDQFFVFLTMYLFYRGAIETQELRPSYLYGAMGSFTLMYLSWEGTGLFLPVFLLSLLVFRNRDWGWMKSKMLWLVGLTAVLVVYLEACWRFIAVPQYIIFGDELNPHHAPQLAFLLDDHDFWFFWRAFLWGEGRAPLTLLALAGLPLIGRDRALAYFYLMTAGMIFSLQFLLEHLITHYFYCLFPALLLIAARTLTTYLAKAGELLAGENAGLDRALKATLTLVVCGMVFITSNDVALRLYRLTYPSMDEPFHERPNYSWIDFRGGDRFVAEKAVPDPIVGTGGHYLKLAYGLDIPYSVVRKTFMTKFYDYQTRHPRLSDKYTGALGFGSMLDLEELFWQHRRLLVTVYGTSRLNTLDPLVMEWLRGRCRVVYHSFDTVVYLWEK